MRLAALVESEDHVCCRYRLAAFQPAFSQAGHSLTFHSLPRGLLERLSIGRDLVHADVVILQRKLLSVWSLARLRRRVKYLAFDFDDAVWLRDSYSPKGFEDRERALRFQATMAACDLVIAGNDYLAAEARKWITHGRVVVVPTCVDVAKYSAKTSSSTPDSLQLVWVGSSSTLQGLEQFRETLSAIGQHVPGTRLKLICDRFLQIPNLPIEKCRWSEATESSEIAAADVGIAQVPDDPWSQGKCGLKVLQYQAAGLPVIANPVGVQQEFVREGVTGFPARSTKEWVHAVKRLRDDPLLRHRLGFAGRRQVEAQYSIEAGVRLWTIALQTLVPLAA